MSARTRFARALRKWADLIDPDTSPSSRLTVTIDCDTAPIMRSLDAVESRAEIVRSALRGMHSVARRL